MFLYKALPLPIGHDGDSAVRWKSAEVVEGLRRLYSYLTKVRPAVNQSQWEWQTKAPKCLYSTLFWPLTRTQTFCLH